MGKAWIQWDPQMRWSGDPFQDSNGRRQRSSVAHFLVSLYTVLKLRKLSFASPLEVTFT